MENKMKKRWISLYVENQVGVLSKITGGAVPGLPGTAPSYVGLAERHIIWTV